MALEIEEKINDDEFLLILKWLDSISSTSKNESNSGPKEFKEAFPIKISIDWSSIRSESLFLIPFLLLEFKIVELSLYMKASSALKVFTPKLSESHFLLLHSQTEK